MKYYIEHNDTLVELPITRMALTYVMDVVVGEAYSFDYIYPYRDATLVMEGAVTTTYIHCFVVKTGSIEDIVDDRLIYRYKFYMHYCAEET